MPRTLAVLRVDRARAAGATWSRVIKAQTTFHVENGAISVRGGTRWKRKHHGARGRGKKIKKKEGNYAGPLMRLTVKYSCN